MRRADLISGALFVALGLVTILVIIPRYVTGGALGANLSPAFMPYVAAALATGAAALLCAGAIKRRAGADEPAPLPKGSWIFVATTAGVLAATFALMSYLGYLAGAAAIVAGFMGIARASVRVVVGAAAAFPVVLWLLFDRLLGFPLP
ncbi:MAG: tripartite tricarboxylate transporter TctB family protein [Gammaproteobacteria bacterium]|nr:tripartite tricarboxylate transporter TctB family protein [Gammaproteobacteria bacterium]